MGLKPMSATQPKSASKMAVKPTALSVATKANKPPKVAEGPCKSHGYLCPYTRECERKQGLSTKKIVRSTPKEVAERRAKMTPMILQWYKQGYGCFVIKTMLRTMGFRVGTDHTEILRILHDNGVKVRSNCGEGGTHKPKYLKHVLCA